MEHEHHNHTQGHTHGHQHGHSHGHVHHHDTSGKNLLVATILNVIITLLEFAGGILSNSFALLSDAVHNLSDAIAVFLAYVSNRISKKPPTLGKTFGFKRIEILAALINSIAMIVICIYLFVGAYHRFLNPEPIKGLLMISVAGIGLIANLLAVSFLNHDKNHNLNVKAAYLHLMGDTLSSVAVVIGGIFIFLFKIWWLDPLLTVIIGLYILKETFGILKQTFNILMQATPPEIDIAELKVKIERIEGVENIHHVHVWKLTDTMIHFECHLDVKNDLRISETETILFQIKNLLKESYSIEHTTIQLEYNCCNNKSTIM